MDLQATKSSKIWVDELKRYRDQFEEKFESPGRDVVKRFLANDKAELGSKYNILWSNVATLKPAIYTKPPKPEVTRRFKDKNEVARIASTILERCLSYEITQYSDYDSALSNATLDKLLPGRGVAWIRYEPVTEQIAEPMISEDEEAEGETFEQIANETTPVDYVYWLDFAHTPARTWEEVTWVARRVYLGKREGVARFGKMFEQLPATSKPYGQNDERNKLVSDELKKVEVWEIWDKPTKTVHWICEHYENELDAKPDPLQLESFFPCPKPLYATLSTDSLIPRSDYSRYQDQAEELDRVTSRIQHLTDMLKVRGLIAGDEQDLARLLKEAEDGDYIPIKNYMAFAEKGGIRGAMETISIAEVVAALENLYQSRETLKQTIYEISGISDILRGATAPTETATAQQIKSQFASIRLGEMKMDVARFACALLRMKAEIMCSKYQPQTLLDMSGVQYLPEVQQNPEIAWQAIQLLQNEPLRNFSIDIENDTLVELDEKTEQQNRVEFLGAVGGFLEKAMQAATMAPDMVPLLGEMLLFGVRGFKIGSTLESTFENTFDQYQEKQKQAPQGPSPEEIKMQAEQQMQMLQEQGQQALDAQAQQHSQEVEQLNMNIEQIKANQEAQLQSEMIKAQTQERIAQMQEQTKIQVAQIQAKAQHAAARQSTNKDEAIEIDESNEDQPSPVLQAVIEQMQANTQAIAQSMIESNRMLIETLSKELNRPKQLIRTPDGGKMSVPIGD